MLQKFIDESIIVLTDDGQFTKLSKASSELSKKLNKDRQKIIPFLFAGIDANIPANNPDLIETKEIISKIWNTYTSVTKDSPLTFLRVIILEAIENLCQDIELANLVFLSANNVIKHITIPAAEKNIIISFLQTLGNSISHEANNRFDSQKKQESPQLAKVDEAMLSKSIAAAVGPTDKDGRTIGESANQYTPPDGAAWSNSFTPKITKAIATSINKAVADQERFEQSSPKVLDALNLKTELLWWKFAGFSRFTEEGYDKVPSNGLPIIVAYDYSNYIETLFPISVNHFLINAYRHLDSKKENIKLSDFLEGLIEVFDILKAQINDQNFTSGRITLSNFISSFIHGHVSTADFTTKTGIDISLEISKEELCLWLFHDIQCSKILNHK